MTALALQVYDLWRFGGMVMPALFSCAFVLWTAIGLRLLRLRRGDRRPLRVMFRAHARAVAEGAPLARPHGLLDDAVLRGVDLARRHGLPLPPNVVEVALGDIEDDLHAGNGIIQVLVAVAPLLGLLGTVTGLISTFGSLGESSTSTASEGIAGGIVEALYATQMGLAIAVPGLLMAGFLRHRQAQIEADLDALRALLCGAWDTRTEHG